MQPRKQTTGVTLVEMMIALVISMLITLAAMSAYVGQSRVVVHQARKEQAIQTDTLAFEVLSRLLRHAETGAGLVTISYTGTGVAAAPNASSGTLEIANDDITINFTLPASYAIWPNETSPYADRFIRLSWSNSGANAYQVRIAKASTTTGLATATFSTVAGSNDGSNARIINLDYWPLQSDGRTLQASASSSADGGYRLTLTARAGIPDPGYINPQDPTGPLKNYRTSSITGVVVQRN